MLAYEWIMNRGFGALFCVTASERCRFCQLSTPLDYELRHRSLFHYSFRTVFFCCAHEFDYTPSPNRTHKWNITTQKNREHQDAYSHFSQAIFVYSKALLGACVMHFFCCCCCWRCCSYDVCMHNLRTMQLTIKIILESLWIECVTFSV